MLPHITHIDWCEARLCTELLVTDTAHPVALSLAPFPWRRLPVAGLAKVSQEEEVKDCTRTHTTTLSATLCTQRRPETPGPMAYRLTAADGSQWMLGTDAKPYPLTTFATTRSDRPGGEQRVQLEVKLNGPLPLLPYRERWSEADE